MCFLITIYFLALRLCFCKQKSSHKRKEKPAPQSQDSGDDDDDAVKEGTVTLQLPSSVFASEVEEDVGMLNKAASQGTFIIIADWIFRKDISKKRSPTGQFHLKFYIKILLIPGKGI